jgi:Ser/Thr protein kinase RdoA (MazF antagonist)
MNHFGWLPFIQDNYGIQVLHINQLGTGHIHQTYFLESTERKFVLQKFNQQVFQNTEAIAHNHQIIEKELIGKSLGYDLPFAIPNKNGELFTSISKDVFRLMPFIDGRVFNQTNSPEQAFHASKAFATLINNTKNIAVHELKAIIPNFHDLNIRFDQFQTALSNTTLTLDEELKQLTIYFINQKYLVEEFNEIISHLPLRLTHNDTKINNLIFDHESNKVKAMVDLDTLMPGYVFYDFGDLVRTACCTLDENSQDWEKIHLNPKLYAALIEGFLEGGKGVLTPLEEQSLPFGGKMMTLIMGLRFLTDHLNGNIYYQSYYPKQNLHRAKNQMMLLESIKKVLA